VKLGYFRISAKVESIAFPTNNTRF